MVPEEGVELLERLLGRANGFCVTKYQETSRLFPVSSVSLSRYFPTVDDILYCLNKSGLFVSKKPVDDKGFQESMSAVESNYMALMEGRVTNFANVFNWYDEPLPRGDESDLLRGLDFYGQRVHDD